MARCFAVAMSQAPGLSGMPDSGHRSSAATRASWARSSATPTSRTMRAIPAMTRADSIRQTASIARWVSEAATASDHTASSSASASARRQASLVALPARAQLPYLDRRPLRRRTFAGDRNRLVPGPTIEQEEPSDDLLGLGERTVDDAPLAAAQLDAGSLSVGGEGFADPEHAAP